MNTIAVYIGDLVIYWSSVVIVLGILAGFCLAYSLYTAHSGRGSTMLVMFAFALVLSVLLCRFLHFYSHQEQYDGLFSAMTNFSGGSFFLPGAVIGTILAAKIAGALGFTGSALQVLDATAPGLALSFALIRLSALFTTACRGKITITAASLQHLPLASAVTMASGAVEYRFATFFVTFILLLIAMLILLIFYLRHHGDRMKRTCPPEGHVFRMFILLYGIIELVMDSTRNDSTFPYFSIIQTLNRFASFVSLTQLFAAISIIIVFVWYSKRSVRSTGIGAIHIVLWSLFTVSLAGVGISEYMVQRHGDMYRIFYGTMSAAALLMAASVFIMYVTCRKEKAAEETYTFSRVPHETYGAGIEYGPESETGFEPDPEYEDGEASGLAPESEPEYGAGPEYEAGYEDEY